MATTKKVAKTPVKAKPVLVSPKKKATVKKTSKKVTAKKSISIRNNTKKSLPTKNSLLLEQKLQNIETLHAQKSEQSQTKKVSTKSVSTIRTQLTLALLSPYRFPIALDRAAISTARFSGVFFVVIGAIFTLLLTGPTLNSTTLVANTYVVPQSLIEQNNSDSSTVNNVVAPVTDALLDTKPAAEFIVNNADKISGNTQFKLKVANASKVTLFAYYKTGSTDVLFGNPTKVSSDTWEMYVNTAQFRDGEYKLKALVTNVYNAYEVVDSKYITFSNAQTAAEQTGTQNSDSVSTAVETVNQAVLFSDKKESSSEFRFEVTAAGADEVLMYAKDTSGARKLIGYAYKSNSTTWKYKWNLKEVVAGNYEIQAEVKGDKNLTSNSAFVKVANGLVATTLRETETVQPSASSSLVQDGETPLAPVIDISLDKSSPLSKTVQVTINVPGAKRVLLYSVPKNSLIQRYVGTARKVDDDVWQYSWDTIATPNGTHSLLVSVENAYGTYTQETSQYAVVNTSDIVYTAQQQETIEKLSAIAESEDTTIGLFETNDQTQVANEQQNQSTSAVTDENAQEDSAQSPLDDLIEEYREEIEKELQRLASAIRVKDENNIFEIKERLHKLKKQIVNAHVGNAAQEELIQLIDEYLAKSIQRVEEDVVRIEKVIEERTAIKAETDTDQDGISDYDEVSLYSTDPYSPDSDADGYTDGSEILSGYNPLDPVSEVLVTYESPKETGIVRDDVFTIDSITTAVPNEAEEEEKPAALISGKGLPNSFVTLYVFSTPIVVTLKTDKDGNWNYRFDKEIEDGEHKVYVGVTDNAGKIVAKSQPFTFVKEAQAFTATNTDVPEFSPDVSSDSFASQNVMYLILSISVVAIGLVLILLGLHLDSRQRRPLLTQSLET